MEGIDLLIDFRMDDNDDDDFLCSDDMARVLLICSCNGGLLCSKAGHGLDDSKSLWHAL